MPHKHTPYQQGQQGALEFTLRKDKDILEFIHGLQLAKQPIQLDTLVIKKLTDRPVQDDLGAIFRTFNIFEFKSPTDVCDIHVYEDLMTYMTRFSSKHEAARSVRLSEITGTLYRHVYPAKLFEELKHLNATVEERFPGVYYVKEIIVCPTQIVVGEQLNPEKYAIWKLLSNKPQVYDVERFVSGMNDEQLDAQDQTNADAVLQVLFQIDDRMLEYVRGDERMSEALIRMLGYGDQYDQGIANARAEGRAEGEAKGRAEGRAEGVTEGLMKSLRNLMESMGISLSEAMQKLRIPENEQARYAQLMQS